MLRRNGIGLSKLYLQLGGSSMKKIRNILSIALVFVMLIGFAPVNVFADGPSTGVTGQPSTQPHGVGTPDPAEDPLKDEKADAIVALAGLKFLSQQDKDAAIDAINDASTKDAITAAGETAKTNNTNAEKKAKEEAVNKIKDLNNLAKDEKEEIEKNIGKAESKDDVDTIVNEATEKDKKAKELAEEKDKAKKEIEGLSKLSDTEKDKAKKAIDDATSPEAVKAVVTEAKKKNDAPTPATYTVNVYTNGYGTAEVTPRSASKGTTVTVKAYPNSGYIVDSIVVRDQYNNVLDLRNFEYKNYYNDYPFWYDRFGYKYSYRYNFYDYRSWCYDTNSTVRSFSNYKYWCRLNDYTIDEDDYDDFIYWYDRYDDDDYYNWRYDRSYTYYDKAEFTMPASNVTVTVTFTSAPYWRGGYYYDSRTGTYRRYYDDDDYYYYRYRKNKKSNYYERQAKADEEENDKAEEEKKAPVLKSESRAVITIGSTILNKADMSGQSIMAMDVAAYVKDGRTMLPIRYVAEALGLQVSWVKETRTVLIWDGINRIEIPVDTNKMIVNSVPYINDVKPEMKNGRTMLAVANIARMLGLQDGQDITWDAGKQQVTFVRKIYSK